MPKILIVDDDPEFVDLLRRILEPLGHKVFSAPDGTVGMMLAVREKPDLIALDYQLPGGDGVQVCERLRGNSFTAGAKILFISAMSREKLDRPIPVDPSVRFLQKPVDPDRLKGLLAELLEGAPPANPPPAVKAPRPRLDTEAFGGDILDLELP